MTNLNNFSGLTFCGDKAAELLQGQTTADLLALDVQQACFTTFCTPKGRMLANGMLFKKQDEQLIYIASKVCIAQLEQAVQRLLPFFKVSVQPIEKVYGCVPGNQQGCFPGDGPGIGFETPKPELAITPTNWLAEWWRRGVVFIRHNAQIETYLPNEMGWETLAVSYTKGCYTGQEIIARMHYRGNPKVRFMVGKCASGVTATELLDGNQQRQGTLIDTLEIGEETLIAATVQKSAQADSLRLGNQPLEWIETPTTHPPS